MAIDMQSRQIAFDQGDKRLTRISAARYYAQSPTLTKATGLGSCRPLGGQCGSGKWRDSIVRPAPFITRLASVGVPSAAIIAGLLRVFQIAQPGSWTPAHFSLGR
jgi:hypothetical protein